MQPNESDANVNGSSPPATKLALPIFVSRFIDEFGLSPAQFRLYAHLARRQGDKTTSWPGIRSIAKFCRMNKSTAAAAITRLMTLGLIEAKIIERKRSSYRIRSINELMNCALISDSRKQRLYGLRGRQLSGNRGHIRYTTKEHKVHHQGATPDGIAALTAYRKHYPST